MSDNESEAMEVWRKAIDAASDSSIKFKTRADQAAARVIATALESRAHGERQAIETRFWAMVDRDGLTGLPSDMWAALDRLVKDRAAVSERDARIQELEGALEPNELKVRIQRALLATLSGTYDCTRVWSAWGYGTMDENDFVPVLDRLDELVDELTDAILTKQEPKS